MLEQILAKLNLKSIDDLTPAERETWAKWAKILGKRDVTIEDLKEILPKELERANAELRKHENSEKKDSFYKAYGAVLDLITKIVISPEKERENLRAFLKQKYDIE
jgi:hypothetical protein